MGSSVASKSVFSSTRDIQAPAINLPNGFLTNSRLKMNGLSFLKELESDVIPVAFFDPQYRGLYEKMKYGNEGASRNRARTSLPQMGQSVITKFIQEIGRVLMPSAHLFLWVDKFHLCTDYQNWLVDPKLCVVDMITWNKQKIGMGYRARQKGEFCLVIQKKPKRAKGVWVSRDIPDVWDEKITNKTDPHNKPIGLQSSLIEAVSNVGDIVIDPAAGSFSVLKACIDTKRTFLGCDING